MCNSKNQIVSQTQVTNYRLTQTQLNRLTIESMSSIVSQMKVAVQIVVSRKARGLIAVVAPREFPEDAVTTHL